MRLKREPLLLTLAIGGLVFSGIKLWSYFAPHDQRTSAFASAAAVSESAPGGPPLFFTGHKLFEIVPASKADDIPPSEFVIGVQIGNEARAYPLAVMGVELGNDVVGGEPIAVAY